MNLSSLVRQSYIAHFKVKIGGQDTSYVPQSVQSVYREFTDVDEGNM